MHLLVSILILFLSLAPSARAETSFVQTQIVDEQLAQKLNEPISLDLRDINAIDVLKYLSSKADLNIVASQNITSRVTVLLNDVTVGTALDIIMLSAGLAVREKSGVIYIMTDEEYTALYGESYRDQRELKVISLKYSDPVKVGEILGGIKSAIGKIVIDVQTGTLVLIDTPEKIKLMEETAARLDLSTVERVLPTENAVFELSYNKASDMAAQIESLLTDNVGSAKFDEKTNRLYVTDMPNAVKKIAALVEAFDRKTREVYIEARMIQVRLNDEYKMGIDWRGAGKLKTVFDGNFAPTNLGSQFQRLVISDFNRQLFEATVDLLQTFGETTTLASPQLTVENNQEAEILVGTREAYVTSTVAQASSTTTTSESITFVDVGVKLKVLPTINKDGFISMKITPEVSAVGRTLTTSNNNEIPIVDTTQASTQVLIKDGHTIMIGGLMKDEVSKEIKKLPWLGDAPLVGALFRSTDDAVIKTELVIFLTPYIVGGDEPLPITKANAKLPEGPRAFRS